MDYNQTIDFLFSQLPMFERSGGSAYKPGLQTSLDLDRLFGFPHRAYRTIHVAGTNGKGSCSSLIAATLQHAGYRVGLYTSPHLVDFRERIVVNGEKISQDYVVDFVRRYQEMHYQGHPSFFELTSTMAFDYFKHCKVDVAVIEVGLGGRLDSTNIITPVLSVITNISLDHTQFLGDTLPKIATEKAGIIKPGVPVVIGEVREVFIKKAQQEHSPVVFAQDEDLVIGSELRDGQLWINTTAYGWLRSELMGDFQLRNAATVLCAIAELNKLGYNIEDTAVAKAFATVSETTGLMARWMTIAHHPLTICDTGHNLGAWQYIGRQIQAVEAATKHIVIGFVKDKDVQHIVRLMPPTAHYYFTQASTPRALPAHELQDIAAQANLQGDCYHDVQQAYAAARQNAKADDFLFIGGSFYLVAELLPTLKHY